MQKEIQKIVLIPAYQPAQELIDLTSQLCQNDFSVVIVDDGSGTAFQQIFQTVSSSAHVITHAQNKGKGEALKTGLCYIKEQFSPPYFAVTADADGQHKMKDILNVIHEAEQHPESLILGSRKLDHHVPFRSQFGNTMTRLVYQLSTGVKLHDTQTGLRAFSDQLIPALLSTEGSRYEYEMNVLMEFARNHIEIREVWIETVYLNQNASSHFDAVRDSYRIYKEILKFSASSFLSFLADYGLFCLLSSLTGMLVFSNITARICSSAVNFTLNQKFVFGIKDSTMQSAVRYFSLAAGILLCNTLILKGLTFAGIGNFSAKIITEIILFLFSYVIQHYFVFRKEHKTI